MKIHHINRDTQWLWQTTRQRILQLWRQKHGRLILLAPVLVFLFTVVWSASSAVSHGGSCTISVQGVHVNVTPCPACTARSNPPPPATRPQPPLCPHACLCVMLSAFAHASNQLIWCTTLGGQGLTLVRTLNPTNHIKIVFIAGCWH